jgi:ABC-2 type transport system ATP-binding protein
VVIELRRFSVRYPRFTLGPLDLQIDPGERVAVLGANGAGKSTTLRAVAGRLPNYAGSATWRGEQLTTLVPRYRDSVGYVPEKLTGFAWLTVAERLRFLSQFYSGWDTEYAATLVATLRLDPQAKVGALSKGMELKLSLVAAEAHRPRILILDEPTSGLDPIVRGEMLTVIGDSLERDAERLVLFSTHILEDVEVLARRIVVLRAGSIVDDQPLDIFRTRAATGPLTRALYDSLLAEG